MHEYVINVVKITLSCINALSHLYQHCSTFVFNFPSNPLSTVYFTCACLVPFPHQTSCQGKFCIFSCQLPSKCHTRCRQQSSKHHMKSHYKYVLLLFVIPTFFVVVVVEKKTARHFKAGGDIESMEESFVTFTNRSLLPRRKLLVILT